VTTTGGAGDADDGDGGAISIEGHSDPGGSRCRLVNGGSGGCYANLEVHG